MRSLALTYRFAHIPNFGKKWVIQKPWAELSPVKVRSESGDPFGAIFLSRRLSHWSFTGESVRVKDANRDRGSDTQLRGTAL